MNEPNRPRGFEDRLLHEFKSYFDERNLTMNATEETPVKTPRFGRATKFSFAGGIGAVALGIGAVVALPALTASPAYAVDETKDGNVHIEVYGPLDPQELEETLAEYGIQSQVDFTPKGTVCDPDRYESAADGDLTETMTATSKDDEPALVFDVNPDNYEIGGDTTLVFEISEDFFEPIGENREYEVSLTMIGLGAAKGEVGDCDPRPVDDDDSQIDEAEKNDDGSKSKNKDLVPELGTPHSEAQSHR